MFGLSSLATKAIGAAVIALMIFLGGMKVEHDLDASKYTALELSYQKAEAAAAADAAAKQASIDQAALAASATAAAQEKTIETNLQQELSDAQAHLSVKTITASCVPYGFLRVLYASSHSITANSLAIPAGKSDAACSPIGWADVATAIIHDYGTALSNANQLNALIDLLRKDQATLKPAEKK